MGARAYTFGNAIAFSEPPNLDTAAHEAAHVVQQRAGISVPGNIGQTGDPYERHADSVADTVTQGRSAETLLAPYVPIANTAPLQGVVQRDGEDNFAGTGLPWRLGPFDVEPTHLDVFKQNVIDRIVNRLAPRRHDPRSAQAEMLARRMVADNESLSQVWEQARDHRLPQLEILQVTGQLSDPEHVNFSAPALELESEETGQVTVGFELTHNRSSLVIRQRYPVQLHSPFQGSLGGLWGRRVGWSLFPAIQVLLPEIQIPIPTLGGSRAVSVGVVVEQVLAEIAGRVPLGEVILSWGGELTAGMRIAWQADRLVVEFPNWVQTHIGGRLGPISLELFLGAGISFSFNSPADPRHPDERSNGTPELVFTGGLQGTL